MSLRAKFTIGWVLVAILAIGLAGFGVHALSVTSDLIVRLYDRPLMGVNYARAASGDLAEARRVAALSPVPDPETSPAVLASLRHMQWDIAQDLRIVAERVQDAGVASVLVRARTSVDEWFRSEESILSPPAEGLVALPTQAAVERQGAAAMRASHMTLATLAGCIIVLSGLFILLFARLVIRPVLDATRIAEDVAAGNMTTIATTTRRDEIGRLMTCLGTMQAQLLSRQQRTLSLLAEKDQASQTLRDINLRFDTALNSMSHGLLMCDRDGRVVVINRQVCDMHGIHPESVPSNATYRDVLALSVAAGNHPGSSIDDLLAERASALQTGQSASAIRTIPGGRTIAISFEPLPNSGWIATHEDISARRKSEEQIAFLARYDALTGLPNRTQFQKRLAHALAQLGRGQGFALLCLDLDEFKSVNDTLGHVAGDAVLREAADRLRDAVRAIDTVARMGGDEFAILQLGISDASQVEHLARRIIDIIGKPYDVEGHHLVIGVSIGISLAPGDSSHPVQLIKNADLALYRAKRDGRGTWHFFEPSMDAKARERRELGLDLRNAMVLGQLELHYQPFVSCGRRSLSGFETLLRWRHPTRGMVQPTEFIPIAEDIGLIGPIGDWILQHACAEAATWPSHLRLAVNLSPLQFRSRTLVSTVADALQRFGIAPERLELEITESVPLQAHQPTLQILFALRDLGLRIALDDFGTGYSSLSYLRSFPFDTIKIDRSFVSELPPNEECAAIVRAITVLGSSLGVSITAEGVETEVQFDALAAAGCTEIQGYLFSRPVPADALPALITRLALGASPASAERAMASMKSPAE
jgi:diguanylate cyclase (GGDEF)-like protein